MYQVLYRKYRPKNLNEVVGQDVIVKTLVNEFKYERLNHAYLFTGPRGTGKTSIAKIVGKMVNCLNPKDFMPCDECDNCIQFNNKQVNDIIEIDAASNNGVDEIRELRNKVNLVPSSGKYKVYIIDEVHMLTISAFNALLKTLEEPPKHIIFILATTEPHKIPATILSRCQRFDFKKVSPVQMKKRLRYVIQEEKIDIDDDALDILIKYSDGGMRDALSLLDQLTAYTDKKITTDEVHDVTGTLNKEELFLFLCKIVKKQIGDVYNSVYKYIDSGKNIQQIVLEIIDYLKNVLIYDNCSSYFEDELEKKSYDDLLKQVDDVFINKSIDILMESSREIKLSANAMLVFELALIKIMNIVGKEKNNIVGEINSREILEKKEKNEDDVSEKYDKIVLNNEKISYLYELKKVRVNNTLVQFNKKDLIEFKNKLSKLKLMLGNTEYSSFSSLVLDGELKAKGNNHLIFVYDSESMEQYFNLNIDKIEAMFKEVYNELFKVIAVTSDSWSIIKEDFNKNKMVKTNAINMKMMEEPIYNKQMFSEKKEEKNEVFINEVDEMFGEIVEYN